MSNVFFRVLICVAAAGTLLTARAQDAALDPDTGLPASRPFQVAAHPESSAFWAKRITGYFTTSDGVRLHYSVLLPHRSGKVPTIVGIDAYDAGSIGGSAFLRQQTAMSFALDKRLVEAGYAVMGVNVAGSGCSEGTLDYIRPQLGRHGADAVEFAASQPWSDGKVGMANWSYAGSAQLATAENRPPHLRAIVPGMVLTDFRDALAPGGVPQPGFVTPFRIGLRTWWAQVVAQTAREDDDAACLAQVDRNLASEETHSVMNLVVSHPLRDEFMNSFDLAPLADRVDVPVLSLEAFQDQAVTPRSGHYQARLDPARLWRVQTNGMHGMYVAPDFRDLTVRFLDRFVKGEANGFEASTPHTTVWMETTATGSNDFERRAAARPGWVVHEGPISAKDLSIEEWHLGAGNVLAQASAPGAADKFDYPGAGVAVNDVAGNAFWGALPAGWRNESVAYTSAPFSRDMLVYGSGSADLWVTASAGDADLQLTVTEVRPDGQETYVQRGWLRLSNRTLDTSRSSPLLPIHLEEPAQLAPVLPGRPVFARVEINKMGHYFRKGSRLRLWIDTPAQTGGLVFDTFTQRQQIHVLHAAKYDSVLRLGVLKDAHGPAGWPACGTVLMQPCRPDPLAGS